MISRLENGHYQSPGLRTLFRVAGGLSVGVAELLPDVIIDPETSLEGSLRSRLIMIAKKASLKDLELVLNLAETVLER